MTIADADLEEIASWSQLQIQLQSIQTQRKAKTPGVEQ
jgi:hypothetical protein